MKKKNFYRAMIPALLLFVIDFWITYRYTCAAEVQSDFYLHTLQAISLEESIKNGLFYPMWHLFVKMTGLIIGDYIFASAIVTSLVTVATFAIVLKKFRERSVRHPELWAFIVNIANPLIIFDMGTSEYVSAGLINLWHNPGHIMVRPFALLAFFSAVEITDEIRNGTPISKRKWLYLTLTVFLGVLAKPSFFQVFVPALGCYILIYLIRYRRHRFFDWVKMCCCFIPGALIFFMQFFTSFFNQTLKVSGIRIGLPTGFNLEVTLVSFFVVNLFPVLYLICRCVKGKEISTELCLSWVFLIISYAQRLLLHETGSRELHGNFGWAYILAVFILYMVSILEYTAEENAFDFKLRWNRVLLFCIGINVWSGLIYIVYCIGINV